MWVLPIKKKKGNSSRIIYLHIISWSMSCVSGSSGSGELACGLHPELQWNKASEWTHSSAQTSGSEPRDRLHRDHRCLHHCWQVQSPANRWPRHFPSGISNYTLNYANCKFPFFLFSRTQTSTDYDECTTVNQSSFVEEYWWNVHVHRICPCTWNVLLRKKIIMFL